MEKHRIRAALIALALAAVAACGEGPTEPGEPKQDVDGGSGKNGLVSAVYGQG